MKRFDGKTVLVTGGAGAIGSAAVRRFALEGACVAIADMNGKGAEALAHEIGSSAIAITGDVSDEALVAQAVARTVDAFGKLDVLFNNVGISGTVAPIHELPVKEWDHTVKVNLRSMFLMLQACAKSMIAAGVHGSVVNMGSSIAGWDVLAGGAGYAATKHAVSGLTRTAALDLAAYGIRVNAICPGVIETRLGVPATDQEAYLTGVKRFEDRIPLRRIGRPEDVAAAVAFLASDEARHVTGVQWLIDGGQTLQSWANAPESSTYPRF